MARAEPGNSQHPALSRVRGDRPDDLPQRFYATPVFRLAVDRDRVRLLLTYVAPPVLALSGSPWGIAAWGMMTVAYVPALRFYRVPVVWAPLLPLIAIFYLGATVHSAVSHWRGRGGLWKGRTLG